MLEACRTCLKLININNSPFYEIKVDEVQPPAESCRYKLLNIVPDMALNITPKSILCAECHGSLESVFEFKKKCLKTENIIAQYIQSKHDLDIKNLDLKDISAFNTGDIKISEDKSVRVLVDEVIVKEGVEIYDTAFVKHEVDNFSFESVDVAVPHSSAEIKISEEAVETSIKVVAAQKEVEFSDNVVSNVKHEVNDFSTESVEVVLPKNVMPGSNFTCEYCDMRCKRSSSLKMHLRTHTGEKSHLCKICNRRFLKKYNLTLHLRIHTGERPYVCEICCKDFRTKSKLTLHMRSHTGEKPYCCEICDCRFHLKHHLTNHLRTHTAEKPYHCETCNRSFEQKSKLTKHLSIHTGKQPYVEKPYCCKICHFRFLMQSSLTDHMRTHTGEKPYRCEICERGFALKSNLTKHIRIHTGERPYVCNICSKGYPSSGSLKKHIRTNHKEQPHQLEKETPLTG